MERFWAKGLKENATLKQIKCVYIEIFVRWSAMLTSQGDMNFKYN